MVICKWSQEVWGSGPVGEEAENGRGIQIKIYGGNRLRKEWSRYPVLIDGSCKTRRGCLSLDLISIVPLGIDFNEIWKWTKSTGIKWFELLFFSYILHSYLSVHECFFSCCYFTLSITLWRQFAILSLFQKRHEKHYLALWFRISKLITINTLLEYP